MNVMKIYLSKCYLLEEVRYVIQIYSGDFIIKEYDLELPRSLSAADNDPSKEKNLQ